MIEGGIDLMIAVTFSTVEEGAPWAGSESVASKVGPQARLPRARAGWGSGPGMGWETMGGRNGEWPRRK